MRHATDELPDAKVSRQRGDELIAWLRGYAGDRINSRLIDERRCIPPYIILDFGNRGLMGMRIPESYGGLGLRHIDSLRVIEQVAAIDQSLAAIIFTYVINGTRPILMYGTAALREELLPRLATGRELAAFALSEPRAGANLGGLASQARPDGNGGWRLRGLKRWNASSWAGIISVFVRQLDAHDRLGGLSGFVVRQGAPGLRVGPEALTMGMRGTVQNSLYLDEVAVGPDDVLGQLGRGMDVAEDALTNGRLYISSVCLKGARLQAARNSAGASLYGGRRTIASGMLLENPVVLATLGELTALITGVESLRNQIAERLDAGGKVIGEAAMAAKVIASDGLNWATGQLMQLLGGRGYMENNVAPQILRDGRLWSIAEGPNEPLTIQLGRKARLTDEIAAHLRSCGQGAPLAELLATSAREISQRCVNAAGPFADRSTAQLWADVLIGQVASDTILLAATREAKAHSGSAESRRAVDWAEAKLAHTLESARIGSVRERLVAGAAELVELVAAYDLAIGDVTQTLAGQEEALDSLLAKNPTLDVYSPLAELPGHAAMPNAAIARESPSQPAALAPTPAQLAQDHTPEPPSQMPETARAQPR